MLLGASGGGILWSRVTAEVEACGASVESSSSELERVELTVRTRVRARRYFGREV